MNTRVKTILKADVLRKFSVNALSKLLGISRPAIDHWRDVIPQNQAEKLVERDPLWRRRPDFDRTPYRELALKSMQAREIAKMNAEKNGKKRKTAK